MATSNFRHCKLRNYTTEKGLPGVLLKLLPAKKHERETDQIIASQSAIPNAQSIIVVDFKRFF